MSDFAKINRLERVAALNGASTKARAVWALIHTVIDRRGQMLLGGADWRSILARRIGVDARERQWFHAALTELERIGIITVSGDVFTLHGHAGGERPARDLHATSDQPTTNLPVTYTEPTGDLHAAYSQPTGDLRSGSARNDSTSAPRARQNRREEKRVEESERENARAREPEPPPAPPKAPPVTSAGTAAMLRNLSPTPDRDAKVIALVSETRGIRYRPSSHQGRDAVSRLGEWAEDMPGGFGDLRRALEAFWRAKGTGARLEWLADDPNVWIGEQVKPKQRGMAPPTSHAEFARIVEQNGGTDVAEVIL